MDLDLEGLHRYQSGTVYRVVAEVKNEDLKKKYLSDGLKKIQWAGDVIINDDAHHYYRKPYSIWLQLKAKIMGWFGKDSSIVKEELKRYLRFLGQD